MKSKNSETSSSGRIIILTVLVVFIIAVITGVIIYADKVAPLRATVVQVDDSEVSMRYFLKRAAHAFDDPRTVLQTIVTEEIVKKVAPNPPYSIKVGETDIDRALREIAINRIATDEKTASGEGPTTGEGEAAAPAPEDVRTLTEAEFKTWYKQELADTGFTDEEYRESVRVSLLQVGLNSYLAGKIPTVAEQVHLYIITLNSKQQADDIMKRLDAGEDFLKVGEELKSNDQLVVQNVDIGWRPRSAISASIANVAFDQLEVGKYSPPFVVNQQYYAIIKLVERAKARQVDDDVLQMLKSNAFDSWMQQEFRYHNIAIHGIHNGYDEETDAWVTWQLQKMREKNR